jgi:hypothetical protein
MKPIYLFLIAIILSTLGCKSPENLTFKDGKVIIYGHSDIQNIDLQIIMVKVVDVRGMSGKRNYIGFIDSVNNFKFEIDLPNTQDISLSYNKYLTLFVSPGDSFSFISINFSIPAQTLKWLTI